jgi:putative hemolysin
MTGGGAKYAYETYKDWKNRPPKEITQNTFVDASIATIARARDELAEDNARLRTTLAEERAQFNAERQRYISDINRLEAQIRAERDDFARRYESLLEQVRHLKERPSLGDHTP